MFYCPFIYSCYLIYVGICHNFMYILSDAHANQIKYN
jgi:hypothetical protein